MGTHPIFESDFDCLTDFTMSLAGTWKRVKADNAEAFGKVIGATEEQLKASAIAVSTVTYTFEGGNVKVERCHKYGDKELKTCNVCPIGGEGEFDTMGHKIKAKVTGDANELTLAAVSGWATGTAKVVGGQLVENIVHNESKTAVTTYWAKQ